MAVHGVAEVGMGPVGTEAFVAVLTDLTDMTEFPASPLMYAYAYARTHEEVEPTRFAGVCGMRRL